METIYWHQHKQNRIICEGVSRQKRHVFNFKVTWLEYPNVTLNNHQTLIPQRIFKVFSLSVRCSLLAFRHCLFIAAFLFAPPNSLCSPPTKENCHALYYADIIQISSKYIFSHFNER